MAKTETPAVPSINLNGKTYPIADLSATAKAQLQNLQIAANKDTHFNRLPIRTPTLIAHVEQVLKRKY